MKRIISKKHMLLFNRNRQGLQRKGVPSLLVILLLVASAGYKKPMHADAGRGALFGGLSGAAIGGAFGGGRGAGIGAAVGLGVGAIAGSSRSRGRDPYRKLDRLERKLAKQQDRAASYRDDLKTATSERRRNRVQKRLSKAENQINSTQREISKVKQNLGVRQQPIASARR